MKNNITVYTFILLSTLISKTNISAAIEAPNIYKAIGVGGGGALSGVSISPYADLWFVGTDMGTVFRSTNKGKSWFAVHHKEIIFGEDLTRAASLGFASDGVTVFHTFNGENPKRSTDQGITFQNMKMPLLKNELIKYWQADSKSQLVFCGTNFGLLRSKDNGLNWERVKLFTREAIGTFFDHGPRKAIFHATSSAIYKSYDGQSFSRYYVPRSKIRQFTGGRDASGLTVSFADSDGSRACSWATQFRAEWGKAKIAQSQKHCGYVWLSHNEQRFNRTQMVVGDHLKMAENDSSTIYVTGSRKWIRQYGTKIHVSRDKGATWQLKLHQLNWDVTPYQPWPQDRIEYSAVALDVGWWDDGYESFEVHKRNSSIAAGAGYFFLHSTQNFGDNWQAPFTQFADAALPEVNRNWRSRGIEVISVYKSKFHPANPSLLYSATADIGGMISEDGGETFRISKAQYNSNYDYAFDVKNDKVVYAASGNTHDFPKGWYANVLAGNGGIYYSADRGHNWQRLTPDNAEFNKQFLSVAYDSAHKIIYGGSQEKGIIKSSDQGKTWSYLNDGLPTGSKIIPQIEIDQATGDVYALVTGNAPQFTNQLRTGIYKLSRRSGNRWELLRGVVHAPSEVTGIRNFWFYPTKFALDLKKNTLWLVDYENNGNWLQTGVWKSTDMGKNWHRMLQLTHATDIILDPRNSDRVHVSGSYELNGNWGNGGQMYSEDGGKTWQKNEAPSLQHNAHSVTKDPANPQRIIYSYFGGGMLTGPDPAY